MFRGCLTYVLREFVLCVIEVFITRPLIVWQDTETVESLRNKVFKKGDKNLQEFDPVC